MAIVVTFLVGGLFLLAFGAFWEIWAGLTIAKGGRSARVFIAEHGATYGEPTSDGMVSLNVSVGGTSKEIFALGGATELPRIFLTLVWWNEKAAPRLFIGMACQVVGALFLAVPSFAAL